MKLNAERKDYDVSNLMEEDSNVVAPLNRLNTILDKFDLRNKKDEKCRQQENAYS